MRGCADEGTRGRGGEGREGGREGERQREILPDCACAEGHELILARLTSKTAEACPAPHSKEQPRILKNYGPAFLSSLADPAQRGARRSLVAAVCRVIRCALLARSLPADGAAEREQASSQSTPQLWRSSALQTQCAALHGRRAQDDVRCKRHPVEMHLLEMAMGP